MIQDAILKIKERISRICSKIDRDPGSITIVAVSKGRNLEQIKEVIKTGITDIGENRVKEAVLKYRQLSAVGGQLLVAKWHMVGHLQTNKVDDAVEIFDLIHSVDSLHLAAKINKQAAKINKIQDILVQIKTSAESTKSGLNPDEAIEAVKKIAQLKNITIKGLMTIAPVVDRPEEARPYFGILRELRDKINQLSAFSHQPPVLSMGMTDDFEVAIEEGSNMIRLGRAIFSRQ